MLKYLVFLAAILLSAPACASIHGGPGAPVPPAGCTYPTALEDGCAAANPNGSFKVPGGDLFAYAAQAGQTWPDHHPQTWNVAGVQYPVGYDTTLTLKDPKNDKAFLPLGCAYSDTANPWGGPQVLCDKAINPTLNGWDFSGGHGSEGCVYLKINRIYIAGTTPGGLITITNNKFRACNTLIQSNGGVLNVTIGAVFSAIFSNNEVDGNAAAFKAAAKDVPGLMIWNETVGSLTEYYNYFHDVPALPQTGTLSNSAVLTAFNFVGSYGVNLSGHHGAYFEILNGAGSDRGSIQHSYNVIISPQGASGQTAPVTFLSSHSTILPWSGAIYAKVQIDHNTQVVNKTSALGATAGEALSWVGYMRRIDNWVEQDNWVDPTGAFNCILNAGGGFFSAAPSDGAGFIDNGAGAGVYTGIAGNTLTITKMRNGGFWEGATWQNTGMTNVVIQPYTTGSSCDGRTSTGTNANAPPTTASPYVTYCVDGAPQAHVLTTGAGAVNTPVTNIIFGGTGHENKSLRDGGVSPITLSGIQWNAGSCPGHF